MITITKHPEDYSGILNPIALKAITDNLWQTVGAKTDGRINVTVASIVNGNYLQIIINGIIYQWTFVTGTAGADQISLTGLSISTIVAAINANRDLYNKYEITALTGPDRMKMVARNFGNNDFTINTNNGSAFALSGMTTAGVDYVRKEGFRILADVYLNGVSEPIGTYEPIPDTDYSTNWATIFIENVLKPYLKSIPPKCKNTGMISTTETVKMYSVKLYEKYLVSQQPKYYNLANITDKYAFNGGFNYGKWPVNNVDISNDYFTVTTNRKFLTQKPRQSYLHRHEEQYLYFWCGGDGSGNLALIARWTVYYKDGTDETLDVTYAPVTDKVAIIPAWLEAITGLSQSKDNIIAAEMKAIYDYSGGGSVESEVFTWEIMPAVNINQCIQIKNSMGGYDSWMMTGDITTSIVTESIETQTVIGEEYLDPGASPYKTVEATDGKTRITQRAAIKLGSGWLDKEHADWMISTVADTVLVQVDDMLHPYRVTDKNSSPVSEDSEMLEVVITLEEAFISNR